MKKSINYLITGMILLLFVSSCSKDEVVNTTRATDWQSSAIFLVADHWTYEGNGIFENRFNGVLGSANTRGSSGEIKVYLLLSDQEHLIGSNGIQFMGGELRVSPDGNDLKVMYKIYSVNKVLPFEKLMIKVIR